MKASPGPCNTQTLQSLLPASFKVWLWPTFGGQKPPGLEPQLVQRFCRKAQCRISSDCQAFIPQSGQQKHLDWKRASDSRSALESLCHLKDVTGRSRLFHTLLRSAVMASCSWWLVTRLYQAHLQSATQDSQAEVCDQKCFWTFLNTFITVPNPMTCIQCSVVQNVFLRHQNFNTVLHIPSKDTNRVLLGSLTYCSLPGCPFPIKSLALSACVSSDNSFPSVRQEPSFGPWKGSPFLQQMETLAGLFFTETDILTTRGTQGPACLPVDQTQRPQLGPFCPWSPPDADSWPKCPDR